MNSHWTIRRRDHQIHMIDL